MILMNIVLGIVNTEKCVLCAAGAGEAACTDGDALSGDQVTGAPVHSGTSQDH
jgi:hypothetical protein